MKVKRCPICMQELLKEDAICQYCGKIHYQTAGASLMDRESRKTIKNVAFNRPILYVTDNFFAFDKDGSNAVSLTAGGAAAFGVTGALIGGLADEAVCAARRSLKSKSTALYYGWEDVSGLSYPMKPWPAKRFQVKLSSDTGIDVYFKDGSELAVWINSNAEKGKELYDVMNMLHQKSISQVSANQGGNVISQTGNTAVPAAELPKRTVYADTVQEKKAQQPHPFAFAGMASGSGKPEFFKCAYCGVTQLREGDFCAYCGKPVPAPEPPKQNASSNAGVVICPSCGNRQEAGSKFCFQCGQKLAAEPPRERNCPHCGAKVKDGMLFCMECGTRLT